MKILTPKLYSVDRYVLATTVHCPKGTGPFPAVILLPGFLGHKDEMHIVTLAESLASEGMVALRFDTAGSGGSEGTIEEDYLMSNYMNDIDSMITYLAHQQFVKKEVFGLWGYQMGGVAALCFAAEYPSRIGAVATVSVPDSMAGVIWKKEVLSRWEKEKSYSFQVGKTSVSVPFSFIKDARCYDASDSSKALKCPFLSIVGTEDAEVPLQLSLQVYENAPQPKNILEIPGKVEPSLYTDEQLKALNQKVCGFFSTSLP
ncbi:MAG: alpha/beta fold hydrolase [Patescibacteria group bacterium]|nr:alpha/beta fold hydrolase [Patescibacteria group bacterium]